MRTRAVEIALYTTGEYCFDAHEQCFCYYVLSQTPDRIPGSAVNRIRNPLGLKEEEVLQPLYSVVRCQGGGEESTSKRQTGRSSVILTHQSDQV